MQSEEPLPSQHENLPYVFVADDAFALSANIMKPFPGVHRKGSAERIFNYRLSRARRTVENVFGIMAAVFNRVFRKSEHSPSSYSTPGTFDSEENGEFRPGTWRRNQDESFSFAPLQRHPRKASRNAREVRQKFSEYFQSNDGSLPWPNDD